MIVFSPFVYSFFQPPLHTRQAFFLEYPHRVEINKAFDLM